MTIFELEKILVTDDKDGASALFENLQNSVTALADFEREREREKAKLKTENLMTAVVLRRRERIYALLYAKALRAALAYEKANKGYHFLKKGDRRYTNCQQLKNYLENEAPQPNEEIMKIDALKNANDLDKTTKLAIIAVKAGEDLEVQPRSAKEQEKYIKKNQKLHKLVEKMGKDETEFIHNYRDGMQVLKNLAAYAEGKNEDLVANVEAYSRFFEYRARMIANPLHKMMKDAKSKRSDAEKRAAFYAEHPEISEDVKNEYEQCRMELDCLEKEQNLTIPKAKHVVDKNVAKGSWGSKKVAASTSFATFKGNAGREWLRGGVGVKGRIGKIGFKTDYKYFKFSVSGSAGGAKANTGYDIGGASVGVTKDEKLFTGGTGLSAAASAYALKGRTKIRIGGKNTHISFAGASELGSAGTASFAHAGVFKVEEKDSDENVVGSHTDVGFAFVHKRGYAAYTLGGTGGISILGIKLSVTLKGAFGGAGASVASAVTTGKIGLSLGLVLGVGTELGISIDWSNLTNNIRSWWRRRGRVKEEKREKKLREKLGAETVSEKDYQKVQNELSGASDYMLWRSEKEDLKALQKKMQKISQDVEDRKERPLYVKLLKTVDERLEKLSGNMADKDRFDRAMAALVTAKLFEVQKKIGLAKKDTLEGAVHTEKQLEMVMDRIRQQNDEKQGIYWNCSTEAARKKALSQANINRIVKEILKPVLKTENAKKTDKKVVKKADHAAAI